MPKLAGNVENFTFEVTGVSDELKVLEFRGEETISRLFHYHLTLVCTNSALDFEKVVGKPAVLTFYDNEQKEQRFVNGIVGRFVQSDDGKKLTTYSVLLVPQIWNMQFRHDCRIFQQKKIDEIIKEVLDGAGIPGDAYKIAVQGAYQKRDYCVQYRESDLNFIQRLMEQEGMFYYFEHKKDGHVLHIVDHLSSHKPIADPSKVIYLAPSGTVTTEDAIFPFIYSEEVRPGGVAITDYNFTKPSLNLMSNKKYSKDQKLEIYDYPGEYEVPEEGARYANVQMESWQVARKKGHGESDVMRLVAGFKFTMDAHPRSQFNKEYLLTRVVFTGKQPQVLGELGGGAGDFNAEFFCIPADVQFRPQAITPKPVVEGIQTAIVVGPSGEEIYTDEHGRVKVQFHWDRQGKKDENSSCWIRVSQYWAGENWGSIHIPRIGHEVVVDFIEGDPDRPLITGRVYHGTNVPPYGLPGQKNISGIKSNSTKGGKGYNEMIFDDTKGKELIRFHGEKDWDITIKNDKRQDIGHDETLHVGHDRSTTIDNDQKEHVKGNKTINVDKNHKETIKMDMDLDVDKNQSIRVKKDKAESIGDNSGLDVGKNYSIKVGKKTSLDSGDEIVFVTGSASVIMKKNGDIQIKGSNLNVKMSGKIKMKASAIDMN